MAGYREFQTGEVLTAANVDDFLAKQAVMKFADAAARDAALGTAVVSPNALREGMVAYLDDTDEVIKYDGTDWTSVAPAIAGIGSNVVQTIKDDGFTTSSATYVDVTGLAATITPSSDTSKVLVIATVPLGHNQSAGLAMLTVLRGSTDLVVPDSPGSDPTGYVAIGDFSGVNVFMFSTSFVYLDSPATDSATTYKVQCRATGAADTAYVNRNPNNNSFGVATLTVIEVEV